MSKIVVEEFDVCHKFIEEIKYLLPLKEKNYVEITHVVSCLDFVIFISYDNKNFFDKIKDFTQIFLRKPKKVIFRILCGKCTVHW